MLCHEKTSYLAMQPFLFLLDIAQSQQVYDCGGKQNLKG